MPLIGAETALRNMGETVELSLESRSKLIERIRLLKRQNDALQLDRMESEAKLKEALTLAKRSGLPIGAWKYVHARVIGRDPAHWWSSITINAGLNQNVRVDQAVVTPRGLVGRVVETHQNHALVALVGEPRCQTPVRIAATDSTGIVVPHPQLDQEPRLVKIDFLPRDHEIPLGSVVTTSGAGGVFPPTLRVGAIAQTQPVGFGAYQQANLELAVDFNKLDYVWVLQLPSQNE